MLVGKARSSRLHLSIPLTGVCLSIWLFFGIVPFQVAAESQPTSPSATGTSSEASPSTPKSNPLAPAKTGQTDGGTGTPNTASSDPCGGEPKLDPKNLPIQGWVSVGTPFLPGADKAGLTVYPPPGMTSVGYDLRAFARPTGDEDKATLVRVLGTQPAKPNDKVEGQSVWVSVPEANSWFWPRRQLFVAACRDGKVAFVATTEATISRRATAGWLTALLVPSIYLLISWLICRHRGVRWSINPVKWSAVEEGRGRASLAILQSIWFTVLVSSLAVFFLLRLGTIGEISDDILWMLGIPLIGTTAARAIDAVKLRLSPENYTWIVDRGWIKTPEDGSNRDDDAQAHNQTVVDQARLGDIFFEAGRFEPSKYQAVIFSLVVSIALVLTGFDQLATFQIPHAYLILLSGSQAVYILGKGVAPDRFKEASELIAVARQAEEELRKAAAESNIKKIEDAENTLAGKLSSAKEAIERAAIRVERLFAVSISPEMRAPRL
ncbi:MAG: hypothetical protein IPK78_20570 [Rhodospirillales bacterium]|nr:hypothetical protein [Rhodospirillales bacterium]